MAVKHEVISSKEEHTHVTNRAWRMKSMSLPPLDLPPIPATTAAVARAAFPAGNVYMQMRDHLGNIYANHLFASVYATEGQPALHPWHTDS